MRSLRQQARAASPVDLRAVFPTESDASFIFGDEQHQSEITLHIPTLREAAGIQFQVENTPVKGDGFRFDPAVQIRQFGDITHVMHLEVPIGEEITRAKAFGSGGLPNIQSVPVAPDTTELAITHDWKAGVDPRPGDEAVVRASKNTLIGSRTQGPTSIVIGNDFAATKLTLETTGVRYASGSTEIDYRIASEVVGQMGFGTGLDVMVCDGTTLVDEEAVSFGTSGGVDESGTITVNGELRQPCLRFASIEGNLFREQTPPVGWSCGAVRGGGGGGDGGAGALLGGTTLLLGGAAVLAVIALRGDSRRRR